MSPHGVAHSSSQCTCCSWLIGKQGYASKIARLCSQRLCLDSSHISCTAFQVTGGVFGKHVANTYEFQQRLCLDKGPDTQSEVASAVASKRRSFRCSKQGSFRFSNKVASASREEATTVHLPSRLCVVYITWSDYAANHMYRRVQNHLMGRPQLLQASLRKLLAILNSPRELPSHQIS